MSASNCGGNDRVDAKLIPRTIKYCHAVLHGRWIVDIGWVQQSGRCGFWIDETPHEIEGDHKLCGPNARGLGAPQSGRRRLERREAALLVGWSVVLQGNFTAPKKIDLRDLLTGGGATVCDKLESALTLGGGGGGGGGSKKRERKARAKLLVLSEEPPSPALTASCEQHGVKLVRPDWLLDSISYYELRPHREYVW